VTKQKCNGKPIFRYVHQKLCITDCALTKNPHRQPYYHEGSCMALCPEKHFGYDGNGKCLVECPADYFGDPASRTCKSQYQCNTDKKFCISDCSTTTSPKKRKYHEGVCVTNCP
jgi:hypothetical protein